jgi:hypothetical protein
MILKISSITEHYLDVACDPKSQLSCGLFALFA